MREATLASNSICMLITEVDSGIRRYRARFCNSLLQRASHSLLGLNKLPVKTTAVIFMSVLPFAHPTFPISSATDARGVRNRTVVPVCPNREDLSERQTGMSVLLNAQKREDRPRVREAGITVGTLPVG